MKQTFSFPSRKDPTVTYTVTVTPRPGIAQVGVRCSCPVFKFGRWQECWHALEVVKKLKLFTVVGCVLYNRPEGGVQ